MKMRNKLISLVMAAAMLLCGVPLAGAETGVTDVTTLYKTRDVDDSWDASGARVIDLNTVSTPVLTLSAKGDYVLSGTYNGQIVVDAAEDDKVRLILNGVSITSPEGPAIYEKQADKLIITLAEGTQNTLTDGTPVTDDDDTIGAALYAEDDLSVNGSGSLTVNGTQKHGIQSKADLILANGNITVTAVKDGVRGRNSVLILDGTLQITAGGDGITATRTDSEGKGWIVLAGGHVTVRTGEGAGNAAALAQNRQNGWGGRGGRDDWGKNTGASDDSVSQKAVKAAADLTVVGGEYTFDCADDGLHGVNVLLEGGTFTIRSGDDGIHADNNLTVNGGTIAIPQCYEGLEGSNITVNGGDIQVVSSDDGLNVGGGTDGSGFGGWGRGGGMSEADSGGVLTIGGGTVSVSAGGDALDSNGSIRICGGVIGVWAATTMGEGAIDFNGTGTVTGGTLIVASTGGVMTDTARLSGQSMMAVSASGSAGETIALLDGSGVTLASFTPAYGFDTVVVSSEALAEGSACSVTAGGRTAFTGDMTGSMTAANGNGGFGRGGFGGGDFGGGFGGGGRGGRGGH